MIILIRLFPLLISAAEALIFYEQVNFPLSYPWLVAIGVLIFPIAAVVMSWRRIELAELGQKMTPSFLLLASLAFALLLAEGRTPVIAIIVLAALSSYASLELLFLLLYAPSRYPVNGLSHVNLAYVPLVVWYAASTSSGLPIFLHSDRLWHVVMLAAMGGVLFRVTGHPGASRKQNALWSLIGVLVGTHTGLLGLMLPLGLAMQGLIASILLASALRIRRYMYDPKPSRRQGWIEGAAALATLALALSTAKWT